MSDTEPNLAEIEERLDRITTDLMLPLRSSKTIDASAVGDLGELCDDLERLAAPTRPVPMSLVGKLWFLFTAMLGEAEHTREPEPILATAWEYADRLNRIFGPHF